MSGAAQPALRVEHLAKQYAGGVGVSDVSFTVEPGQITGFIGVNGAGKSTTLRCILGLSEPDAGDIEIFGERASFRAALMNAVEAATNRATELGKKS